MKQFEASKYNPEDYMSPYQKQIRAWEDKYGPELAAAATMSPLAGPDAVAIDMDNIQELPSAMTYPLDEDVDGYVLVDAANDIVMRRVCHTSQCQGAAHCFGLRTVSRRLCCDLLDLPMRVPCLLMGPGWVRAAMCWMEKKSRWMITSARPVCLRTARCCTQNRQRSSHPPRLEAPRMRARSTGTSGIRKTRSVINHRRNREASAARGPLRVMLRRPAHRTSVGVSCREVVTCQPCRRMQ